MLNLGTSPEGRAHAAALRDMLVQHQSPRVPLFAAAANGRIGVILVDESADAIPARLLKRRRPLCVLIGADYGAGEPDPAPADWRCAQQLKFWTRAVIAHGAAGDAAHYRLAAEAAETFGRVVFIEASGLRVREWVEYLCCARTLALVPDGVHPVGPRLDA